MSCWNCFEGSVGEASDRRGGAFMGFPERIDIVLNWTELNSCHTGAWYHRWYYMRQVIPQIIWAANHDVTRVCVVPQILCATNHDVTCATDHDVRHVPVATDDDVLCSYNTDNANSVSFTVVFIALNQMGKFPVRNLDPFRGPAENWNPITKQLSTTMWHGHYLHVKSQKENWWIRHRNTSHTL